jgi:hypothetical protein
MKNLVSILTALLSIVLLTLCVLDVSKGENLQAILKIIYFGVSISIFAVSICNTEYKKY